MLEDFSLCSSEPQFQYEYPVDFEAHHLTQIVALAYNDTFTVCVLLTNENIFPANIHVSASKNITMQVCRSTQHARSPFPCTYNSQLHAASHRLCNAKCPP